MKFNEELRNAMIAAGYGVRPAGISKFAKACDVTPKTVRHWLTMEEPDLSAKHLHRASNVLRVRMRRLMEGEGVIPVSQYLERAVMILDRMEPATAEKWLKLGEGMRDM